MTADNDGSVELDPAVRGLERALGHDFAQPDLLLRALTHRSLKNERPQVAPHDNERLEFLGDAVIGLVIAAVLSDRFPSASEGELTRRRADLVSESALADVARTIDVGAALRLGRGEEKSGGRDKPRLLASAFEACIGAIYRDAGLQASYEVVARILERKVASSMLPGAMDFKSRAQEWAQANLGATPTYRLVEATGPDHHRHFVVAIDVEGETAATGQGRSKSDAEQDAARLGLEAWLTQD